MYLTSKRDVFKAKIKNSIKNIGVTVQMCHLKVDILNWKHCCLHPYTYFMGKVINQLKKHSTQDTNWQVEHSKEHKELQMYTKEKHSWDVGC